MQIYNEQLNNTFSNYKFKNTNVETQLLETYNRITNCAKSAFKSRYHPKNDSPVSKSWWTPEVNRCKNILSLHFQQWKTINFSKNTDSVIYNRYLMARKFFRKAIKSAQKNDRLHKKYITIESLKNVQPQKFWNKFCNIKKDTNTKLFTINKTQDKEFITSEFADHFEKLLNMPRIKCNSIRETRYIPSQSTNTVKSITGENVKTAISSLKSNKSHDSFNISAEHMKHSKCDALLLYHG